MSSRVFTTLASEDIYSVSLVSQYCMLEASVKIDIACQCLKHLQEATAIIFSNKKLLLECDFTLLLSHATTSPTVGTITKIAKSVYIMEKDLGWCSGLWHNFCASNFKGIQ